MSHSFPAYSEQFKARYTLATKSKGRSKFGRHLGDKNHPLSTKSTELNMFNFGDKLSNSTVSPMSTDGRQSRNFMNINEDRLVKVTVACAQHPIAHPT